MTVLQFALVAVAGGVGAGLRYVVDALITRERRRAFPAGILVVNVTGSFALGILAAAGTGVWVTILGIGLLGGYTTFSTVSVESVLLVRRRRMHAWLNLLGTFAASVVAAGLGLWLGALL